MADKTETKAPQKDDQGVWADQITQEVATGAANLEQTWRDYESTLDMFDAVRSEKDYDWMSDIFIPEFPAHMLTQSSMDVGQYFQSRDFVEVYLEDERDEALAKAAAAKECINRTLNKRNLHYYPKFVRSKMINQLGGYSYARCWWEKKFEKRVVAQEFAVDVAENPLESTVGDEKNIVEDVAVKDNFQFDVLDPRQVTTSSEYTYSIQDKNWVIVTFEKTLFQLKEDKELMGYFNLDKIENPQGISEVSAGVTHEHDNPMPEVLEKNRNLDIHERWGWAWAMITKKDEDTDEPLEASVGTDKDGNPKEGAEWIKVVSTVAVSAGGKTLIRFQVIPFKDATGNRYYPLIRGTCYIHPVSDLGAGDGKYAKEMQVAINDAFNMGNDRSRLATMPVMKGKKHSMEDNSTLYWEPMHVIELEDPNDLVEMKIDDDIIGQLRQVDFLSGKMQQTDAIFPSTMGQLPAASTTATAVAGTEVRTNNRMNYKSMSFEYTFLTELYWMIMQMTNQFAEPETGEELMGDKVFDFDPSKEFFYKPVSQSIETESSKAAKINQLNVMMQSVAQLGKPEPVNFIMKKIFDLMGDEPASYSRQMFPEGQPLPGAEQPAGAEGATPTSNQNGIEQSGLEQVTRGAAQ